MFAHTHIHTNKTKKKNLHAKRESIKISSHLIPKTHSSIWRTHTHTHFGTNVQNKAFVFCEYFFVQFLFINMRSITSPPVRQSGWLSVSQPEYIEGAIGFSHPSILTFIYPKVRRRRRHRHRRPLPGILSTTATSKERWNETRLSLVDSEKYSLSLCSLFCLWILNVVEEDHRFFANKRNQTKQQ